LFANRPALQEFVRRPSRDQAFALLKSSTKGEPSINIDTVDNLEVLDCPLFIISAPRAGSTLLFDLLAKSASLWSVGAESGGIIEGIPALHPAARHFESHRLDDRAVCPKTIETLRASFIAEAVDCTHRRFLELRESERPTRFRLLEKTPENSLRVPFLAAAFASARFVFLYRDGRQNVSSLIEAWQHDGFLNIPALPDWPRHRWHFLLPEGWRAFRRAPLVEIAAFQWNAANQQALDDLEMLPVERWMAVEYAELTVTPKAVAKRICEFAGIPMDAHFTAALERPLPIAATAISHPSPIKWRSNPEFQESALNRYRQTIGRLRNLGRVSAPPPNPRQAESSVRYSCFLSGLSNAAADLDELIVNPGFHLQVGETIPLQLLQRTRFRDRFLCGFPLLWVEDAGTRVTYPFWGQRAHIRAYRELGVGQPAPNLPKHLAPQLAEAGVLICPSALEGHRRRFAELVKRGRKQFADHGFCELPKLLHPAHVLALCDYYEALIGEGRWRLGDEQVQLRHGWHNEMVSRYFHHQFTEVVSQVAGEPVRASYTYLSAYRPGAVLKPHVDRKQCVFTLSVMVERPTVSPRPLWPLWLQTRHGNVSVTQSSGDGVLFLGSDLSHWRDPPPTDHPSTTLIFHYVPKEFQETLD
jgi:hypothetical protein